MLRTQLFEPLPGVLMAPQVGLSGGCWLRELRDYPEIYQWINLPVGVLINAPLHETVTLSLDLQCLLMLNGMLTLPESSLYAKMPETEMDLGCLDGYSARIGIHWTLTPGLQIDMDYWYSHTQFGRSPTEQLARNGRVVRIFEPDSRTIRKGLTTSLRFNWQ
jgi:hypothetical protein